MDNRNKDTFYINSESLMKLGIHPIEAVIHIEGIKASDITPIHVKFLEVLRPFVHSS